ncbi:hypothetical protein ACLSYV_06645 [Avibacterium avium]|uniref:hypothetical protein n=1 Tax=Avibacterium avium TaxID=751 RepID=UPI003BF7B63D
MLANLQFHNRFISFVYHRILSEESKKELERQLTDNIRKTIFLRKQARKFFVKRKPQNVVIFVYAEKGNFVIKAFQFGKTDLLTGNKKAHLTTIEKILSEKTDLEIRQNY